MKKLWILAAVVLVAIATLAIAGYAYAQSQNPPTPEVPFGQGMMNRTVTPDGTSWMRGGRGRGMMGGFRGQATDGEYGPLHDAMIAAMAEAFGMTPEEIQAAHDAGKTMWDIAEEQGLSADEFQALMIEARTKALEQAVAGGLITQEQADWMLSRMNQQFAAGYGPGSGACDGSGRRGGGPGMGRRFQSQQQP